MIRKFLKYFALLIGLLIAIVLAYQGYVLMRLWWWADHAPASTAFMDARLELMHARDTKAQLKYQWVPYARISDQLKRAIIVAEDAKFVDHEGFDWEGIEKALDKNQRKGRIVAGGSTISQQLAKNLFLSGERSMLRKGEEALITLMMEAVLDKQRIFELYLNVIEWGEGVFGAEAAARHYFGVSAEQLDAAQAAQLAAMVPRPRFYDRHRTSPWLLKNTQRILERMPKAQLP